MGKRRMFSLDIIDSDAFLDMPQSAQTLYFHLALRADDDGFIDNVKTVKRMVGSSDDDVKLLFHKNFVIPFEDGVCVIKHWRIHNYIRSDRYKQTNYVDHLEKLAIKDNGSYTLNKDLVDKRLTSGIPMVDAGKVKLSKVSIGKDNTLSSKHDRIDYKTIVDYLNQQANTKYKSTSKKTQSLIKARVNDGFTVDDFKQVIDNKVAEWKGGEMEKYIRPETIFGSKFESYLNQKVEKKTSGIDWFDKYKENL